MDPYRDVQQTCPTCAEPLRTFDQRLCCDTCTGMFLTRADLVASLGELTTSEVEATFVDNRRVPASKLPCPSCEAPLVACWARVVVGGRAPCTIDVDLARCDRHGVWFGKLALPRLFELVHAIVSPAGYGKGKPMKVGRDKL